MPLDCRVEELTAMQRSGLDIAARVEIEPASVVVVRPCRPSWIRSKNCSPRFVYFFAMENVALRGHAPTPKTMSDA
jgi:hypothetical protein